MLIKRLIVPERVRTVPVQFSWVDQRLVRERHIERCDPHAAALYLFLITVADAQGLSYYSDASAARCLSMHTERLRQARADLIHAGLIADAPPLYQVLSLDAPVFAQEPAELSADECRAHLARLRQALGRQP